MIKNKTKKNKTYHCDKTSYETKILQMIGIYGRSRVDLKTIVVLGRVLKQTVHGIEHLV